jgi:uncharacterized protein YjiS (DUF1127 family)
MTLPAPLGCQLAPPLADAQSRDRSQAMIDPPFASLLAAKPPLRRGGVYVRCAIADWFQRYRERRQLRGLSDETLEDCGLTRIEIEREIKRLS